MAVQLKICGMKFSKNIQEISAVQPDYLGFIFWKKSARNFDLNTIPSLNENIKKVGVFVNASLDEIQAKITAFQLDAIQLHGKETPEFCTESKSLNRIIIKAFSVDNDFDFNTLNPYLNTVDYFLFDTKGKLPGGNGTTFDWSTLEDYPFEKPYFLSGGIGLEEAEKVTQFLQSKAAKYCHAIDVNSRFEIEPGLKNTTNLQHFKNIIYGTKI